LIANGDSPDRYQISLNITFVTYPGSVIERQSTAEQSCTGIRTGSRLSMQCSVDRSRYPDWSPDDFTFDVDPSGRTLGGFLLGDPTTAINGAKL